MTDAELDWVMRQARSGKTPSEIHDLLGVKRGRLGTQAPHITNIRKAIQCKTYKRCRQEQRGRKKTLNRRTVKKMNTARNNNIEKSEGRGRGVVGRHPEKGTSA